jgi:hypothetical protein
LDKERLLGTISAEEDDKRVKGSPPMARRVLLEAYCDRSTGHGAVVLSAPENYKDDAMLRLPGGSRCSVVLIANAAKTANQMRSSHSEV